MFLLGMTEKMDIPPKTFRKDAVKETTQNVCCRVREHPGAMSHLEEKGERVLFASEIFFHMLTYFSLKPIDAILWKGN